MISFFGAGDSATGSWTRRTQYHHQVLLSLSGSIRHCALMILLAVSPGRVPSESAIMIELDTIISLKKPLILEIFVHTPQAGCIHNLAFLVVCAHTQLIRPLHPAREWLFAELSQSEILSLTS